MPQKLRESLFQSLKDKTCGKVLDLFAGSGTLGIEALSLGAKLCVFVEKDPQAAATIKRNLRKLHVHENAFVFRKDAFYLSEKEKKLGPYDIIFCDPPFALQNIEPLVHKILNEGFLDREGLLILRRFKKEKVKSLSPYQTKIMGDHVLFFFRAL